MLESLSVIAAGFGKFPRAVPRPPAESIWSSGQPFGIEPQRSC